MFRDVVNQIENESTGHGLSQIANERHKRFGLHAVSVIRVRLIRFILPVVNAQFDAGVIRVFGCVSHGSSHRIEINVCHGTEYKISVAMHCQSSSVTPPA